MEGSAAGLGGGGDAGQAQGDGQGRGEAADGQQQGSTDLAELVAGLSDLHGGQEELRQFLMSQPWQQALEGSPEARTLLMAAQPDLPDTAFGDGDEIDWSDLDAEPHAEQAEELAQLFNQMHGSLTSDLQQQFLAPMQQELAQQRAEVAHTRAEARDVRLHLEAQQLVQEFPELSEPEVAERIVGRGGIADQLAQQIGQPELASKPAFWRLVYMAGRAADMANEERGQKEAAPAAFLEGGGGAMGGGSPRADVGAQILAARGGAGARALPFPG